MGYRYRQIYCNNLLHTIFLNVLHFITVISSYCYYIIYYFIIARTWHVCCGHHKKQYHNNIYVYYETRNCALFGIDLMSPIFGDNEISTKHNTTSDQGLQQLIGS